MAARSARHARVHGEFVAALAEMGLSLLPPEGERLWTLNTVRIPERVTDEAKVRIALRDTHGIEIGAGLGPLAGKIWRVGLMGAGATSENVQHAHRGPEDRRSAMSEETRTTEAGAGRSGPLQSVLPRLRFLDSSVLSSGPEVAQRDEGLGSRRVRERHAVPGPGLAAEPLVVGQVAEPDERRARERLAVDRARALHAHESPRAVVAGSCRWRRARP